MKIGSRSRATEVWAQLVLSESDSHRIRELLMHECGIKSHRIVSAMHLTVYHARRPMPGVISTAEPARVVIPAEDTRFMVLAPGGENPRPHLVPAKRKVGFRLMRRSSAMSAIMAYRAAARARNIEGARPTAAQRQSTERLWSATFPTSRVVAQARKRHRPRSHKARQALSRNNGRVGV